MNQALVYLTCINLEHDWQAQETKFTALCIYMRSSQFMALCGILSESELGLGTELIGRVLACLTCSRFQIWQSINLVWWDTSVIPAVGSQRQEDNKFQATWALWGFKGLRSWEGRWLRTDTQRFFWEMRLFPVFPVLDPWQFVNVENCSACILNIKPILNPGTNTLWLFWMYSWSNFTEILFESFA